MAKALSYRVIGTGISVLFLLAAGKGVGWAVAVGGIETLVKVFAYYWHERTWDSIEFGRGEFALTRESHRETLSKESEDV